MTTFEGFTFKHFDGEWHVARSTQRGTSSFSGNGPVPGTFGGVENQTGGMVGQTRVLGTPRGAETTAGVETPRTNLKETHSSLGARSSDGRIVYGAVTTPGTLPGSHGAILNPPGGVIGSVSVPETIAVAPYTTPEGVVIRDSVIYTPRSVTEQELKARGIAIQNTEVVSPDVQSSPQATPEQPAAATRDVADGKDAGRSYSGYAALSEVVNGLVSQGLVQPGDASLVLRKADKTSSAGTRINDQQARLSLACIIAFGAEAAEAFHRGGYAQLEADGWVEKVWDKPAYRQVYGN